MVGLQSDGPGAPEQFGGPAVAEQGRRALVGPVLQQPGEEQVARLQQGEVLLVLDLGNAAAAGRP